MHPGDQLEGYTLLRLIGRGGFGEVWLCRLAGEGEFRALKFIPAARPDHLEKELEALAGYRRAALWRRTPHLVPIEHARHTSEGFYYVMPLADGTCPDPGDPAWRPLTLSALIENRRSSAVWFTCEEIASGMAPVLDALQCLTDAGLVHRDVKPDNILFFDGRPVLGDVGLLHEDNATLSGRGTPGYLTPSWYEAGHPDMYGAAATLYTWLTGNLPDRIGRSAFNAPPQGDASLSALERARRKQLLGVVRQATDERPAERYRDFQAMKRALAGPREKRPHRNALVATVAVTAGVLAALGIDYESVSGFPLRLPLVQAGGAKTPGGTQSVDEPKRWKDRFVLIPSGSFRMGCASGQQGEQHEFPQHDVQVSAFWMQPTEVTNDQMAEVLNWAMARNKVAVTTESVINTEGDRKVLIKFDSTSRLEWDGVQFQVKEPKGQGHPCVEVSWYGACACCNYRSQMEGLTPCYNLADWSCKFRMDGYRLPTEAEWEKAARGGLAGARFPWAEETISHARANYRASSPDSFDLATTKGFHPDFDEGEQPFTSPAGYFPPNGYGLHDMAGNMWEWCHDWFAAGYYAESPAADPTGPATGTARVTRGGGWAHGGGCCRVSLRAKNPPVAAYHGIGFRPVRRDDEPAKNTSSPESASKERPFVNTLGMAFVPVPGTSVLFCIHETRWKDYARFAAEHPVQAPNWRNQTYDGFRLTERTGDHPVASVCWEDAAGFCRWLSKKEGLNYRLPTDREWSLAVGLGGKEEWNPGDTPQSAEKYRPEFPWGTDWPPPEGAGNYSDASRQRSAPNPNAVYVSGYDDGFPTSAPVMSFAPNSFGLYDVGGNVWEWVEDWWNSARTERVLRGGSWTHGNPVDMMSFRRVHLPNSDLHHHGNGFRVVLAASRVAGSEAVSAFVRAAPESLPAAGRERSSRAVSGEFVPIPSWAGWPAL